MSVCKSCGVVGGYHKAWCMRPAPIKPQPRLTVYAARSEFQVMCA